MTAEITVAFCDLRAAHVSRARATEAALLRVARSGRYVLGEEVDAFEREFAALSGVGHAVGVGSGTDAIALILRASGVGPGDEVIVPAYTAAATWMAVVMAGATPVGADVDQATGLVDPDRVAAAVGPRTAAIVAVHLFGRLAPIAALRAIADRQRLLLVEDAAHAAGVDEGGGPAGSLADAAAFSFYPTKTLGGLGDGGAVTTGDERLSRTVRELRSYGWSEWQGQAVAPGVNSRLDEVQAAVLRERLAELPRAHVRLRALAAAYRGRLGSVAGLSLPPPDPAGEPPWHQFVVTHPGRDAVRAGMAHRGVGSAVHYDPIPPLLHPFAGAGPFAAAQRLAARAISLPFDSWLTDDQVAIASEAVAAAASSARDSSALSRT